MRIMSSNFMEKHVWFDFYWIFLLETKRKETGDLYFL
jgi:hypothetical protein